MLAVRVPSQSHRLGLGNYRNLGIQVEHSQVTSSPGVPFVGLANSSPSPGTGKQVSDSGHGIACQKLALRANPRSQVACTLAKQSKSGGMLGEGGLLACEESRSLGLGEPSALNTTLTKKGDQVNQNMNERVSPQHLGKPSFLGSWGRWAGGAEMAGLEGTRLYRTCGTLSSCLWGSEDGEECLSYSMAT